MKFRPLQIEDIDLFNNYLPSYKLLFDNLYGSEVCFASLFAWKDLEDIMISINDDYLIIKGIYLSKPYFLLPIAKDIQTIKKALNELSLYCLLNNIYLILFEIDESFKHFDIFNDFKFYENYDLKEYIYNAIELSELKGKKYHQKRNHFNKFINNYKYSLKEYDSSNYQELINASIIWDETDINNSEIIALKNILDHYKLLNAKIILLYVLDELVAFTVFVNSTHENELVYILIEKANTNYFGTYQAINKLCASTYFQNKKYINRQEDLGIENIKKAKLSLHPTIITKKCSLIPNNLMDQLKSLYQVTFNETKPYLDYLFNNLNYFNIEYLSEGLNVIGMCLLKRIEFNFFNNEVISYLISGLCVHMSHRNKSYSTLILKNVFCNLLKKEIPFVYLYPDPVSYDYYYHFGFGLMNYLKEIPQDIQKEAQILDLIDFHQNSVIHNLIYQQRNESQFNTLNEKIQLMNSSINTFENGYSITTNDYIDEVVSIEPNLTKPGMVVRILDIKSVLEMIEYQKVTKTYRIKIIDEFISSNNQIIMMKLNEGRVVITDTTSFDFEINIKELTEMIFVNKYEFKNTSDFELKNDFIKIFKKTNAIVYDKY